MPSRRIPGQLQHAVKNIKAKETSKWFIHEKVFAKCVAKFSETDTNTTRDILNIFLKSINKGFYIDATTNTRIDLKDYCVSKDSLSNFNIENSLSLHMTTFGAVEPFKKNTQLSIDRTLEFTQLNPRWFHIGPIEATNIGLQVQFAKEISSFSNFTDWYKTGRHVECERKFLMEARGNKYKELWKDDNITFNNEIKLLQDIRLCIECSNLNPSRGTKRTCGEDPAIEDNQQHQQENKESSSLLSRATSTRRTRSSSTAANSILIEQEEQRSPDELRLDAIKVTNPSNTAKLRELARIEHALNQISKDNDTKLSEKPMTVSVQKLYAMKQNGYQRTRITANGRWL